MKKNAIRLFLALTVFTVGLTYFSQSNSGVTHANEIIVYQSKSCGCCKKWVKHLEDNGFKVKSELKDDVTEEKLKLNLPMKLASCHTAIVNGYIVEGHVPAIAIKKILAEKPSLKGISVPGMPMGSPGMEGSYKEAFDVISFDENSLEKTFMRF